MACMPMVAYCSQPGFVQWALFFLRKAVTILIAFMLVSSAFDPNPLNIGKTAAALAALLVFRIS